MDVSNFSNDSRAVINDAYKIAKNRKHINLYPIHLLLSILQKNTFITSKLFEKININLDEIIKEINNSLIRFEEYLKNDFIEIHNDTISLLNTAEKYSLDYNDKKIDIEWIFLSIIKNKYKSTKHILDKFNLDYFAVKNTIINTRKISKKNEDKDTFVYIKKYTLNLTEQAAKGEIDPVIGRDDEIKRTIEILSRRTKNNPILIGDPGVGKTAIAEGLSLKIIESDIPNSLKDNILISLNMGTIVSGAKFRGDFEERLNGLLDDIKNKANIILFIDEIHTIIGAGSTEGALDASNILKPILSRGELHCIGATTLDEYKRHIEKDAALARRFQPIYIKEPSVKNTISILRGIKEKYEVFHGVTISDSAVISAAKLSNRYISDRKLPDKAIDLIDEAASKTKIKIDSKPDDIESLENKLIIFKIEQEALKKEDNNNKRLFILEKNINELKLELSIKNQKWKKEKEKILKLNKNKELLENAKEELKAAKRYGNLAKAGELTYSKIPCLEVEVEKLEKLNISNIIDKKVTEKEVADVISKWTGIPLEKMLENEKNTLSNLENILAKQIIGQDEALSSVSSAIRRSRAGIQEPNKPIGSFLFLGPTGVGKTELSKAIASFLFESEKDLLIFDMSEFMEKHSVSKLIGSPPGYIGYESGGRLTELVRRRPYKVLLFDEIEKAHRDIYNLLLQVLDEGRLSDGQGNIVDFKNTIIIMTSNLGSSEFNKSYGDFNTAKERVMDKVKGFFRPEMINRLDDIIIFNNLKKKAMDSIVKIQLANLSKRLEEKEIKLEFNNTLILYLAKKGFSEEYGARPLKRLIQKEIENIIAENIIKENIKKGMTIELIYKNNNIEMLVK